ncbi:hypothetical protein B0H19DRAFT_1249148 [Mycena capillaripes]|nr:hypothetical protein B0H19DRAFT_1249148 [Mycena capillaripes]
MSPIFSSSTPAEEVAEALAGEIRGKNGDLLITAFKTNLGWVSRVLTTGTSVNGIGCATARVIAMRSNLVIITGCNSERLPPSEDAIIKETPSANLLCLPLGSQYLPEAPLTIIAACSKLE